MAVLIFDDCMSIYDNGVMIDTVFVRFDLSKVDYTLFFFFSFFNIIILAPS